MVAIGSHESWLRELGQGVQCLSIKGPAQADYTDLYKENGEDELEEMNRLVKLAISEQEYSPVDDEPVDACLSPLLTNSSYNLIESNWHSANQDYHKLYRQQLQLKDNKEKKKPYYSEVSLLKGKLCTKYPRKMDPKQQVNSRHLPPAQLKNDTLDKNPPLVLSSSIISIPVGSRFFVIKSFNQQDITSSFIHKIWSSTDIGNNRLAKAFKSKYPSERIFLLFSVNGSGKFCGVAEMKSSLRLNPDGHENEGVWLDSGRWKGNFKIQWLIIKDISNTSFKHLKFQSVNNFTNSFELKPVTHSRDTQELSFEVGRQMINIFKETPSSTSFLQSMVSSK